MKDFDHIRPFNNDEIAGVKERLLQNDEFISAIARYRIGRIEKWIPFLVHPIVRSALKSRFRNIDKVEDIPHIVKKYIDQTIRQTTSGFTVSGIKELDPYKSYLFISNHRDIALDAAFLNYALLTNGHRTARIAIGDNLLSKPFVGDLIRLNKSFIVKRSVTRPREMLSNFKVLSAYIRHTLQIDKFPVWIAQSEGRAKDGWDKTQPAVIKMITMAKQKEERFEDYIRKLRIVPVAISYELDPNDAVKAKEVYVLDKYGKYRKGKYEDVDSISRGITGKKGRVHLAFGQPINASLRSAEEVALAIDEQIIDFYKIFPSNIIAYRSLFYQDPHIELNTGSITGRMKKLFKKRIKDMPKKHRIFALRIYANPIIQKENLDKPTQA
ncbi:MAG: 1-acyl-sn-glycerol-3-phosphate acyltransferase [Bacteroidia bacterium]|nr:1-acyl-sn-glycerol-3-phosphate acyltransferase [Bacteroidia bacterium]